MTSEAKNLLNRLTGFLASLRLAAIVLGLLAAVLAVATVYEVRYGTRAAQRDIYEAPWFAALLVLLGVNVAAAAVSRWPWRVTQIGFVTTHMGILLVLGGCLTTHWMGVAGRLVLSEGGMDNRIIQDSWMIQATAHDAGGHGESAAIPVSEPPRLGKAVPLHLGGQPCSIALVGYLDNAAFEQAKGTIVATIDGKEYAVDVDQALAGPVPLGDQGTTVHATAYFERATVDMQGTIREDPQRSPNPAVVLELTHNGKNEKRIIFEKFGDINSMHGGQTPAVKIMLVRRAQSPGRVVRRPLTPGADPRPAVEVEVSAAGHQHRRWLVWSQPAMFEVGQKTLQLTFGPRQVRLPFAVRLDKFELEHYAGSNMPAMYRSEVTVIESDGREPLTATIEMNRPLEYNGWSFFQSGFTMDGEQRISILSASKDPGKPIVYAGAVLLVMGTVVLTIQRLRAQVPAAGRKGPVEGRTGPPDDTTAVAGADHARR
jgi:hypothetical protein